MTPPQLLAVLLAPAFLSLGVLHEGPVLLELCEDGVHLLGGRLPHVHRRRTGAGPNFAPFRVVDDQLIV